jgi:hypothetical protein
MVTNYTFSRKYLGFLKMDKKNVQNEKVKILFKIEKHPFFLHMKGTFLTPFSPKNTKIPTLCSARSLNTFLNNIFKILKESTVRRKYFYSNKKP